MERQAGKDKDAMTKIPASRQAYGVNRSAITQAKKKPSIARIPHVLFLRSTMHLKRARSEVVKIAALLLPYIANLG